MGKLADAIQSHTTTHGPTCHVKSLLNGLPKPDRDDLTACLADPNITSTAIQRGLRSLGHSIRDHTLQRHRRGDCGCSKQP